MANSIPTTPYIPSQGPAMGMPQFNAGVVPPVNKPVFPVMPLPVVPPVTPSVPPTNIVFNVTPQPTTETQGFKFCEPACKTTERCDIHSGKCIPRTTTTKAWDLGSALVAVVIIGLLGYGIYKLIN